MARLAGGQTSENLLRYLDGITFPARKDDIVHALRQRGITQEIVAAMEQVPQTDFASAQEVVDAFPQIE